MSDPKPILTYASPAESAPTGPRQTIFTFASPPVRPQLLNLCLMYVACAFAIAMLLSISIRDHRRDWSDHSFDSLTYLITGIILVFACAFLPQFVRLWKVGDAPVCFEARDGMFIVTAPQMWGHQPRRMPLSKLFFIGVQGGGVPIGGVRIFDICVDGSSSWVIRVAIKDRDVLTRSIEDLKMLIPPRRLKALHV